MRSLLITGFAPFGGEEKNASWEAVSLLPEHIGDLAIVRRQLPVEYDAVRPLLRRLLAELRPDAVLCVGQAAGRAALTPEKIAINWMAASLPDNAGRQYTGQPILPGEPDGLFSTLPLDQMVAAMHRAGVPAAISYTAGAYVCNCTMYHLLHLLRETPGIPGGFLHVPCTCGQTLDRPGTPSLPLPLLAAGLQAAISALAAQQ